MDTYVILNNNFLKSEVKKNSFYRYIELNLNNYNIEINEKNNIELKLFINNNLNKIKIDWVLDNIYKYKNELSDGSIACLNCDLYDDFLKNKILIQKRNGKIYLYNFKHIVDYL